MCKHKLGNISPGEWHSAQLWDEVPRLTQCVQPVLILHSLALNAFRVPSLVNPTEHLFCAALDLLSVSVFIYSNHYTLFCMLCVNTQLCWKNGLIFRSTMDVVEETKIIQMVLSGVGFSEIECMRYFRQSCESTVNILCR